MYAYYTSIKRESNAMQRKNRVPTLRRDWVSFKEVVLKCFPVTLRAMRLPRRSRACEEGFRHRKDTVKGQGRRLTDLRK